MIESTIKAFQESTPGSLIEIKDSHVTFHYRNSDPEYGRWQALEIREHLELLLTGRSLEFHMEDSLLEVRPKGMNKSIIFQRIDMSLYDFVHYIGSDHDIFLALKDMKFQSQDRTVVRMVVNRQPMGCQCDLEVLQRHEVDGVLTRMLKTILGANFQDDSEDISEERKNI